MRGPTPCAYVQLPPVVREGDEDKAFAFNAESWPLIIDAVVQLAEVFRQKDARFEPCVSGCRAYRACRACRVSCACSLSNRFQAILHDIRQGACADEAEFPLNTCGSR